MQLISIILTPQEQYIFIHDVVLESVTCGDTQINANDLNSVIMKLKDRDQVTGKTQFETQFEVCLNSVLVMPNYIFSFRF